MGVSKGTIIRTVLLVLAIVNSGLQLFGKSTLPITTAEVEEVVSFLFLAGTSLVAWWKDNAFTEEAIKAKAYFKELKKGKK